MTDEWFRIIVAAGVGLAALSFVVQAIVVIAFYGSARKAQRRLEILTDRADPVIQKMVPLIDAVGPAVERAMPMLERSGSSLEKMGPLLGTLMGSLDKTSRKADEFLTTAKQVLDENRPRVAQVSDEVASIARSGRVQVEKLGEFLTDASERARSRLEQIDDTVASTVEHVEEAGETVKNVVMRPVREVNGLAAGISAAVSSLVRGRKSNVASATQDEEMFI